MDRIEQVQDAIRQVTIAPVHPQEHLHPILEELRRLIAADLARMNDLAGEPCSDALFAARLCFHLTRAQDCRVLLSDAQIHLQRLAERYAETGW